MCWYVFYDLEQSLCHFLSVKKYITPSSRANRSHAKISYCHLQKTVCEFSTLLQTQGCSFRDKVPFRRHRCREGVLMPGCVWMCGAPSGQWLMSMSALDRVKLPPHVEHSATAWSANRIQPRSLLLPLNEADTSPRTCITKLPLLATMGITHHIV